MSLVVLAQLRFLRQSWLAVISALLGMTLGVASVVGVHLLSERVEQEVTANSQPLGGADLYLQRTSLRETDYFELRKRWRAGALPGVRGLVPIVEGPVRFGGRSYQLIGTDLFASTTAGGFDSADGALSESVRNLDYLTRDSLFAPAELIEKLRATSSATATDRLTIELNGVSLDVLGSLGSDGVLVADLPSATRVLGMEERLSRVAVQLHTDRAGIGFQGRLRTWVRALFPGLIPASRPGPLVGLDASWQQLAVADALPTLQLTQSILFNIAALSLLSLVVAWLLTYQVAQHAIGRRQAMFMRLLSMGVTRRRLNVLALMEGCVIGVLAVVLGLLLGRALANGLFTAALGSPPDPPLAMGWWVFGKALVSGLGVGVVSYLFALRAARSRPGVGAQLVRLDWVRYLVGGLLLLGFCWGALDLQSGLAGAFLTIVTSALALVIYLPEVMSWLWRATLRSRSGTPSSALNLLPVRQLLVGRELRLGISALTLALATALGIAVMVDSFRSAFVELLDRRLVDDVALEIAQEGGLARLEAQLVGHQTRLFLRGTKAVLCDGVQGQLEYASDDLELAQRFGAREGVGQGELLISESFAYFHDVQPGDQLVLQGALGSGGYRVAAVFADFGETKPRVVLRREDASHLVDTTNYTQALIKTPEPARLRADLAKADIAFDDPAETKRRALAIFQQTFGITRALTALALIVALVALANALSAQALALAPAENLLRALGVAPRTALRLRLQRAGLAGGLAVGLAAPLGLLMAWLLCNLVNPRAFGWQFPLQITPSAVFWPLGGGLLAALLSSLIVWRPPLLNPAGNLR